MKVLLMNSSPRKNGATAKILNEMFSVLQKYKGIEAEVIHLSDFSLEFCKGCSRCFQTGECYLQDDAEHVSRLISGADALVIGAPTYASSIPGQLKTMIDRGHFVLEQLLHEKYTIAVATYENADGVSVIKAMNKLALYSGAVLCGNICVKVPFNQDPLHSESVKKKVRSKTERLYQMLVKRAKGNIFNRVIHHVVFNVGIKPFIYRAKNKYGGVIDQWEKRGVLHAKV